MKTLAIITGLCGMFCLWYGGYIKGVKDETKAQQTKIDSLTAELENYKLLYKIAEP